MESSRGGWLEWFESKIMLSGGNATVNSVGEKVIRILKNYFGTLI